MASSEPDSKYMQGKDNEESTVTVNIIQPQGIILSCNRTYVSSFGCIVHFIQLLASAIGLICLAVSSSSQGDMLYLPLNWHLRAYIFGSVFAILINVSVLALNISSLIEAFPLNWQLCELVLYGILSLLYLCTSSMVGSAVSYYRNQKHHHISERTGTMLIFAAVIGFVCFVLYGISVVLAVRNLRRPQQQFASHRLPPDRQQSTSTQTSESKPEEGTRT